MSYQHLEITKNLLLNDLPEYYILYVIMNLYDYIYFFRLCESIALKRKLAVDVILHYLL